MGCFDTVWVQCPECKQGRIGFQTKSGACTLANYTYPGDIPQDVMWNVDRHDTECVDCDARFRAHYDGNDIELERVS